MIELKMINIEVDILENCSLEEELACHLLRKKKDQNLFAPLRKI